MLPRATRRALRLGPLLATALVPVWCGIAARIGGAGRRQEFRGLLAPLLLVTSLMVWIALLAGGFGLMFYAERALFEPALPDFRGALYQASSALFTLGLSNEAATGAARLSTVAAGLVGLAIVTVGATFLVSVQSALHRREVLVLSLAAAAGRPPSGLAILESYAHGDLLPELGALFDAWGRWAADVLHSHRAYPILVHFRSTDENDEWLAALGAVLDAAALLVANVEGEEARPGLAGARLFLPMGCRTIHDMARLFELEHGGALAVREGAAEFTHDALRTARERLAAAGYRLRGEDREAREQLAGLRAGYAADLHALADRFGFLLSPRIDARETCPPAATVTEARPATAVHAPGG